MCAVPEVAVVGDKLLRGFRMDGSAEGGSLVCRDGQCPEYSGEEQAICAVGLVKAKPGVFIEAIHHLIVLATPVEVSPGSWNEAWRSSWAVCCVVVPSDRESSGGGQ